VFKDSEVSRAQVFCSNGEDGRRSPDPFPLDGGRAGMGVILYHTVTLPSNCPTYTRLLPLPQAEAAPRRTPNGKTLGRKLRSRPTVIPAQLISNLSGERESTLVIPAQAGIQLPLYTDRDRLWMESFLSNSSCRPGPACQLSGKTPPVQEFP
jgi:hypothetical protein